MPDLRKCPCCGGDIEPVAFEKHANMIYLDTTNVKTKCRWIPCRERLPESREGVIFTADRGHPFVCVGYRINNEREKLRRWFDKISGLNFSDYDVTAWMPIPDAYEPPGVEQE